MCASNTPNDLTLTPVSGSGCGCCSTDSTSMNSSPAVASKAVLAEAVPTETADTSYALEGLTCGHCVKSVETAVAALSGVDSATVELISGAVSTLSVTGDASRDTVQAAVEKAGYSLTAE